jgi:UDP:flavonoid glycosyltransferase YjiC (YdhE family)
MRIVIVTVGSLGDTAPFIGLGARLQAAGHEVAVAAQAGFEAPIRAAGLEYRRMPGDIRAELASENGQRIHRASSWLQALPATLRLAETLLAELAQGIVAAARGADVLLVHRIALLHGHLVARALGIPLLVFELFPSGLAPTSEFLPANFGAASLGSWGNRAVYRLLRASAGRSRRFLASVDAFQASLGAPRADAARLYTQIEAEQWPIYHAFSAAVVPRPSDWRAGLEIIGYLWPERSPGWRPPAELVDFLEAGPPPVYIGLGSLVPGGVERLAALFTSAARQAKVRALIQSGWGNLATDGHHADVLSIGSVPHDWLFPRMAAVVHAAGAGVTGAGLRAGVPAVPVPAMNDQPIWASRLVELGASPGSIRFQKLSAEHLAHLIRRAVTEPSHRANARALAERLRSEDAAARVLRAVEAVAARAAT